jgi:hypothetical protein
VFLSKETAILATAGAFRKGLLAGQPAVGTRFRLAFAIGGTAGDNAADRFLRKRGWSFPFPFHPAHKEQQAWLNFESQ